ncbi:MAG: HNH endonuclease [Solibacillus sp.]
MNFYIVMQGRNYIEEKEHQIIWSQQLDKSGQTQHFWERMKEVKSGDVIFHYVKGEIVAISKAQQDYYEAQNPYTNEEMLGYAVKTMYEELEFPINIKEKFQLLEPVLPIKYSAFQENGDGNQGYLYPCNDLLAIKLLEVISDRNIYEEEQEQLEFSIGLIADKTRNTLAPFLIEVEAEAKRKIRKGQQKFTQGLLAMAERKCVLCDITLSSLVCATHSKPWKDSTEQERLDPYNGLLLCRNHSVLYKEGYIAFDGTGKIHISLELNEQDYLKYGLHSKMRVQRLEENKPYFKWHKRNVFKGD